MNKITKSELQVELTELKDRYKRIEQCKTNIITMILSMNNEDYLLKTYHYLLAKYKREKGMA